MLEPHLYLRPSKSRCSVNRISTSLESDRYLLVPCLVSECGSALSGTGDPGQTGPDTRNWFSQWNWPEHHFSPWKREVSGAGESHLIWTLIHQNHRKFKSGNHQLYLFIKCTLISKFVWIKEFSPGIFCLDYVGPTYATQASLLLISRTNVLPSHQLLFRTLGETITWSQLNLSF